MMRKLLKILLFLIFIVLAGRSTTAFAADYNVWVGGVQVTSDNANGITGPGITGTVTYDATTKTLTLNNANITGYRVNNGTYTGICSEERDTLSIVLVNTNTVNISVNEEEAARIYVILADRGSLSFSGSGSLTVQSGTAKEASVGIYAYKALSITNCTVNTAGGVSTGTFNSFTDGISCIDSLTIQNATVRATGGPTHSSSTGIRCMYNVNITNSTVTATGNKQGIYSHRDITTNGVTVIASTSIDGSNPVTYVNADTGSYKWVKTEYPHRVTILVNKDNAAWGDNGKTFKLVKNNIDYTDLTTISNGIYDVYEGATDTGVDVTVADSDTSVTVDYYTVSLTNSEGIASTSGSGTYLKGSNIVISAVVSYGYNWNKWVRTNGAAEVSTTNTYTISNIQAEESYIATAIHLDVLAVEAAKNALKDGTVNVAFGADQTAKTSAVQDYVDGILSSIADAVGITATVTYNSTTGQYEIALIKGSANDSKSLTMTVNVAPDPDIATVASAKTAAQNASYSDMTQETATSEAVIVSALKATADTAVNNSSVTTKINQVSYLAPVAGTSANPSGTDGSYSFSVILVKGEQTQTTIPKTINITATAFTGITDVQAVAAANTAIINGTVNVAFGADQATKTAAVQDYVDGIINNTADAAGVTATVVYNSTTEKYEVTIAKGSQSSTKSLTMTVNVAPDPDIATVASAKTAAENASYSDMTQETATSEAVIISALKATADTAVNNSSVTTTITQLDYLAPVAGTSANPSGTDGSYSFIVTLVKGDHTRTTIPKTISITATAFTGVTDVQAVAAASTAIVNGTVNVAFGADQTAKTAAVQTYVNGILGNTADALGVTATVVYNSVTEKYEVTLNKGSVNDSKSLTMTITVAPAPAPPAPAGGTQTTETKTITVVEVPQSIQDEELLTVEPVGEAFDNSVEVRLKEDTMTEAMVRTAMESASSALNIENAQIFPLDISIYLKGTNTKVQPKEGTAVMITCPIPKEMLVNMDKLVVVCIIDRELQVLPVTLVTKDGVPCVQFTANHFSPYALVIDKDNNLADYAAGTSPEVVTNISTKLTATAGTLTKVNLEGIKEGSIITYHVCTPTLISIDSNGNLFAKKAGNAILMAKVTHEGATTLYTIRVTVKNAKGGTKVGFIRYYDEIVTYNKINYRITSKATATVEGTVAVANNQVNNKLPKKVVIPETITYKGKTYKVTSIDESAFYNQNKITSVSITAGVEEISATAFVSCDSLKTFTVSSNNKYYSAKKGMLLNKEGTTLIAYPSAKGTIVIDKKVAVIGAYAFSACKYLTGVVIPKTVTRIEGCAFADSKFLSKVTFQSTKNPVIPFLCIFEHVNKGCTILVPEASLIKYQDAFKNARMPKGTRVNGR